jgi:metallo-beta-lactamase class B
MRSTNQRPSAAPLRALALGSLLAATCAGEELVPDATIECGPCADWNRPQEPFRVFANTYYVGTAELGSILIATDDGLILLDGALPQSVTLIDANIRALGFRTEDVRLILSSHAHFDHVGGVAALQRASGAIVAASPSSAAALRGGKPPPDDPQYASPNNTFAAVPSARVIRDGEKLAVGGAEVTAHFTPGHTPGGTTWSWRACESERCLDVVYADSLNAVSADGFRFTGSGTSGSIVAMFEESIRTVAELRCDILLSPHSGFFGMVDKLERRHEGHADAFVDASACRRYADAAAQRLEGRVAQERGAR